MHNNNLKQAYLNKFITIIAIFVSIFHIYQARWMFLPVDQHKVVHVASGLLFVFLGSLIFKKNKYSLINNLITLIFALLSILFSAYILFNYHEIVTKIGVPAQIDIIAGGILVLLVLEGTRRAWGPIIPTIVILSLAYGYFGSHLPGILFHGGLNIRRLIAYSSVYFQGIYGSLTGAGAMEVFMFILYGCILEKAGGIDFFMTIASRLGGRLRSGPAQSAVLGSAFMGTISGSVAANVATTGKITIPLMIKNGYTKELAGAVEAVASTGGQLMPPVMGVVAFLMASTTNNHYFQICKTALFPALIFYLYLAFTIQIRAERKNLSNPEKDSHNDLWAALKKDGYLLISLFVLIYSLAIYLPPAVAAYNAIVTLFILFALKTFFIKRNWKTFIQEMGQFFVHSLSSGAKQATKLGLILACLGIMVELFVVTGFAQKISFQMIELAGGNLLLMLGLIALTCILFGMGMPTVGTYMVVSVLSAPALVKLGIPLLAAHMFVFYYGLMAMVTPPVGVGVIVATGITEGNYFKTAFHATKLALPGFILPLFFIFRPEILWIDVTIYEAFLTFIFILTGLICLASIFERFFLNKLNLWEIITLVIICYLLLSIGKMSSLIGLFFFFFFSLFQYAKYRKKEK